MKDEEGGLKDVASRTREFAVSVVRLYSRLPKSTEAQVIGKQMLRSGTSVGAHYREASRARSDAEFVSKIEGGLQELEETRYWFELLRDAGILGWDMIAPLDREADELTAILVSMAKKRKKASV
jgi:four helix bundle protein